MAGPKAGNANRNRTLNHHLVRPPKAAAPWGEGRPKAACLCSNFKLLAQPCFFSLGPNPFVSTVAQALSFQILPQAAKKRNENTEPGQKLKLHGLGPKVKRHGKAKSKKCERTPHNDSHPLATLHDMAWPPPATAPCVDSMCGLEKLCKQIA